VPDFLDILRRDEPVAALVDAHRTVTYRALRSRVGALAAWLTQRGVRNGDRVAVSIPDSIDCVELFLATAVVGAVWVGTNAAAPQAERQRQLDAVEPRLVIGESDVGAVREAAEAAVTFERSLPDAEAPCAIAFTSGTTGTPKALVHSRAGISLVAASAAAATLRGDDRVGVTLPLSILNIVIIGPLAALVCGATAVVLSPRNAAELASACLSAGLTLVRALVPATVYDLVHESAIAPESLSSLRVAECGAAGLPENLREQFEAKFGLRLTGSYGLSEAPAVVCHEDASRPHRPGASGTPLPHVSISIRDEGGREAPVDTEGEIWVGPATAGRWIDVYRPALGTWSKGQLDQRNPDEHAFPTGDLGWLDSEGALHVSARKSDVIVRGGINVTATELQSVLAGIPGVRDVAVVGRADLRLGERIVAYVELTSDAADVSTGWLRERALELLSRGKVPDDFMVMPVLPRNAMGKVAKAELLAHAAQNGGG
jgi:acyl-CoA synthetase (AMP-forming)/AMP-acid ligase II